MSFGFIGPLTVHGNPSEDISQPNCFKHDDNVELLLFLKELSPSIVISESKVAAKAVIILATVPEFPQ